jgi:hypothetical protein
MYKCINLCRVCVCMHARYILSKDSPFLISAIHVCWEKNLYFLSVKRFYLTKRTEEGFTYCKRRNYSKSKL